MTTLREAAQQMLEALEAGADSWRLIGPAIDSLRAALAQEEQEPVAWIDIEEDGTRHGLRAWSDGTHREHALYTAPPQRKPLSKDETMRLMNETSGGYWADEAHIQRFRVAIERAHGIGGQDES